MTHSKPPNSKLERNFELSEKLLDKIQITTHNYAFSKEIKEYLRSLKAILETQSEKLFSNSMNKFMKLEVLDFIKLNFSEEERFELALFYNLILFLCKWMTNYKSFGDSPNFLILFSESSSSIII